MNKCFTYSISSSFPFFAEIHTFYAKEKDTETGLSVTSLRSVSSSSLSQAQTSLTWRSLIRRFGSRYYSSDLSIWLSVDPMSDKYPSLSPYTYCANNPVKLVDPNGEEIGDFYNEYGRYLGSDGIDDHRIYQTTMGKHGDDWAAPSLAAAFNYAVNQTGVTVVVNDVSAYDGITNLGHKSHRNGFCVDFRYVTEDGMGSSNYLNLTPTQINLNNVFLDALHTAGFRSISGGGDVKSTLKDPSIHYNHIHIDRKY